MPEIPLSGGLVTIVDEADYADLMRWSWQALRNHAGYYYAVRNADRRKGAKDEAPRRMNRYILGLSNGNPLVADHINGNTLDNRRCNLRAVTWSQSNMNRAMKPKSTGFVGIKATKYGKWEARINVESKYMHLGTFDTIESAVAARLEALNRYHGEFARTA